MQIEVLADRELGIKRERLRHVADAHARFHIVGIDWRAEKRCPAFAGGQQPREHFHGRRLAAAVGAHEAEDLSSLDVEIHVVDCREIAESTGQVTGDDHWRVVIFCLGRNLQTVMAGFLCVGKKRDEGILDRRRACLRLEVDRRTLRKDAAAIHRDQPVESLRFLHIRGRDNDAHAPAAPTDAFDQVPELTSRQRIDPGRGLVEDQQIGIVDQCATEAKFLSHAAGQLPGRSAGERRQTRALQQLRNPHCALGAALPEQPTEKIDILPDAEIGIQVLSQPLRHEGDAGADEATMVGIRHVAAKHRHLAVLDPLCSGDQAKQG